jgi:hypothetical protein
LTPQELNVLGKVASGDTRIGQENMRRLFMLRLVDREAGVVQLTREGRLALGLEA